MWNSENLIRDYLKANDLNIFSRDYNLPIGKRIKKLIKKVLGFSLLGFSSILFPNLALTIVGGALLYSFHKFRYHQLDNVTADDVGDLSNELDVSDLEEARELKRVKEAEINDLKNNLNKASFRRSLFLESSDLSLISTGLAVGACIFTPMAIPFVIGSSILHGVLTHKEIKYTKKEMDLKKQIEAEENNCNLLNHKISSLESEANNENADDNENVDANENVDDNENALDDDEIQFDSAQRNDNNNNTDNNDEVDTQDLDEQVPVTGEVEDLRNTDDNIEEYIPINDDIEDVVDNSDEVVVNDVNQRHNVSNNRDVNPFTRTDNINHNRINPSSIKSGDKYHVPTYNPLYEKAVDLYLDSLTVDYGRNRDPRIEEVINKVYSK